MLRSVHLFCYYSRQLHDVCRHLKVSMRLEIEKVEIVTVVTLSEKSCKILEDFSVKKIWENYQVSFFHDDIFTCLT